MGVSKEKGDLAEVMVMAEAMRRGYRVAIPYGENWACDLIVVRAGRLERVQCKYVESDGNFISVACSSTGSRGRRRYTSKDIDWLAVYDRTTDQCYFIPADFLGQKGRAEVHLRLSPPRNNQARRIAWAKRFEQW